MVVYMLRNPLYCGYSHWSGVLRPGKHESIVSVSDFKLVQVPLAERRKVPSKREAIHPLAIDQSFGP